MAYNLQPLITILEQILNPKETRWIVDHNKPQLQSLLEKSVYLQQILEKSSLSNIESLESQIRAAAHKAEDTIESHMVDQMLSRPGDVILDQYNLQPLITIFKRILRRIFFSPKAKHMVDQNQTVSNPSFTFSTPDLQQVIQALDSVMEQVAILSGGSSSGVSFSHYLNSKSIVDVQSKALVGGDEDLTKLKDRLMGMQSKKLQMVPIVGMGGIGKTTLARKLYRDPAVVEHFTSLAWTTVSEDYNLQAILLSLLRCIIGKESEQYVVEESRELKDILYRSLYGRRYMIVLDDVWSIKFWDEIRRYLPETNNGSRIVITTRELDVAKHANSHGKQHEMQLLNESDSWNLLRQEVFGDEEDCPAALETIGRNIATNCGGLPLAICVIGGLLSKANRTKGFWENVANDVRAALAESDGHFSDILSLSYNHLPSHLRPCFLYFGAFPENYEIEATRLINLWVAEGFLKSNGGKSLEEEAEDCLKALVERNLVSVRAVKCDGRPKSYGMHDLMRDLCLKKVEQRRFLHVGKKQGRVSIHPSTYDINLFYRLESMYLAPSFLCIGHTFRIIPSPVLLAQRLLRVLDLLQIKFQEFPTEILQILNLRYLAFAYTDKIFCDGSDWGGGFILDKLQTILSLNLKSSLEFLHRIPNVKKLGIEDESSDINLYHLHKLENLRLFRSFDSPLVSPLALTLPLSLKNLSLRNHKKVGRLMNYLCELPNLELLKLKFCHFEGREWDATQTQTQQEFCTLKFLLLDNVISLVKWQADETNFPRLRHLVIRECPALEEIPSGIGEIATLQTIELVECSPSLVASAKLIIEEQRENGNDDLQLRV